MMLILTGVFDPRSYPQRRRLFARTEMPEYLSLARAEFDKALLKSRSGEIMIRLHERLEVISCLTSSHHDCFVKMILDTPALELPRGSLVVSSQARKFFDLCLSSSSPSD